MLIYIATDKSDGTPILSSFSKEKLLKELDEYNGAGKNSTKIEDRKIEYSEFEDSLERVITYESEFNGEIMKDTFYIFCLYPSS